MVGMTLEYRVEEAPLYRGGLCYARNTSFAFLGNDIAIWHIAHYAEGQAGHALCGARPFSPAWRFTAPAFTIADEDYEEREDVCSLCIHGLRNEEEDELGGE